VLILVHLPKKLLKLLIIDNYDSFTYNLIQLFEQAGVSEYAIVKNDMLDMIKGDDFDRIVISPGPGIAAEANQLMWFLKKFYKSKPVLGICLGHEAIAELFGGSLIPMKESMHGIINQALVINNDKMFTGIPSNFNIGHYHSWIIDETSLPDEIEVILRDENNLNMAIKHIKYNLIGFQFHPESVMTEYGLDMINNWLKYYQ